MKVKFKMDVKRSGEDDVFYIVNGTATNSQIDEMLEYLLKIKARDALAELDKQNAVL